MENPIIPECSCCGIEIGEGVQIWVATWGALNESGQTEVYILHSDCMVKVAKDVDDQVTAGIERLYHSPN